MAVLDSITHTLGAKCAIKCCRSRKFTEDEVAMNAKLDQLGCETPRALDPVASPATFLAHRIIDPHATGGMVNPPVYRASTVMFRDMADMETREKLLKAGENTLWYGRKGTPTSFAVARALARLEGGHDAIIASSGLMACVTAIQAFVSAGDHMLVSNSVYGPTREFIQGVLSRFGVTATFYDPSIGAGIAAEFRSNTRLVYVESPGSYTFEVQDVPAIAAVGHARGAGGGLGYNSGTPLYFKPFEHGVDVSVQAATKYIVGHSDATLGVITATREHWDTVREHAFAMGVTAGGDDLYLAQRGLRTLPLRMERHWQSGVAIADWLASRPEIATVLHPALPGALGHALWRRDFTGASGLFSVIFKPCSTAAFRAFVDQLQLFGLGFSWGGFESLVMPFDTSRFAGRGLRLHVGLEAVQDLLQDLKAGFDVFARISAGAPRSVACHSTTGSAI
jgi:cystathionine beta-lyase